MRQSEKAQTLTRKICNGGQQLATAVFSISGMFPRPRTCVLLCWEWSDIEGTQPWVGEDHRNYGSILLCWLWFGWRQPHGPEVLVHLCVEFWGGISSFSSEVTGLILPVRETIHLSETYPGSAQRNTGTGKGSTPDHTPTPAPSYQLINGLLSAQHALSFLVYFIYLFTFKKDLTMQARLVFLLF